MNTKRRSIIVSAAFLLLFAVSASAQKGFRDVNVEYVFSLPNDSWKMTVKPSTMSPNVEYVFNFRKKGHLEIRKISIEPNTLFGDIVRGEELKLQFVPGYVSGREENFRGTYAGRVFNYEYVRSGRNMSGRYYLLKTDATTVYILRFTGEKASLLSLRSQTDFIARTFKLKGAK